MLAIDVNVTIEMFALWLMTSLMKYKTETERLKQIKIDISHFDRQQNVLAWSFIFKFALKQLKWILQTVLLTIRKSKLETVQH